MDDCQQVEPVPLQRRDLLRTVPDSRQAEIDRHLFEYPLLHQSESYERRWQNPVPRFANSDAIAGAAEAFVD